MSEKVAPHTGAILPHSQRIPYTGVVLLPLPQSRRIAKKAMPQQSAWVDDIPTKDNLKDLASLDIPRSYYDSHYLGRVIKMSPESVFMIYEILFFATYAVGWIVTLIWNYEAVSDNAVTRVFGKYNMCIGVDTFPARYITVPISYLSIIAFLLTAALFFKRMLDQRKEEKECSKYPRGAVLIAAVVSTLLFTWTIGVRPIDAPSLQAHLHGFVWGMVGWALLKLASILEFGYFHNMDDQALSLSWKEMCHTRRKVIFLFTECSALAIIGAFAIYMLTKYNYIMFFMPHDELNAILNTTVPTDIAVDEKSLIVIFTAIVCPIVAFVVSGKRRRIRIGFMYRPVGKANDEGVHRKYQDTCLDRPCCCWKVRNSEPKRLHQFADNSCGNLCTRRLVTISPEAVFMIYDILFFATYAVGWIMTFIWNYEAIDDNAVTRVFKNYNMCIGVDTYPARYLAIPMSYVSIIAFLMSAALFFKRMLDQPGENKKCSKYLRGAVLIAAMFFSLLFAWTIGIRPIDPPSVKMHLHGFVWGMVGWALLKLASILEFGYFHDMDDDKPGLSCKDMFHTWRKVIFLCTECWALVVIGVFVFYMLTAYYFEMFSMTYDELDAILNTTVPTDIKVDEKSLAVIITAFVCPIVAFMVSPQRRHITIGFKYRVGVADDKGKRCYNRWLDRPCCKYNPVPGETRATTVIGTVPSRVLLPPKAVISFKGMTPTRVIAQNKTHLHTIGEVE